VCVSRRVLAQMPTLLLSLKKTTSQSISTSQSQGFLSASVPTHSPTGLPFRRIHKMCGGKLDCL
jgi:hypothetical protein